MRTFQPFEFFANPLINMGKQREDIPEAAITPHAADPQTSLNTSSAGLPSRLRVTFRVWVEKGCSVPMDSSISSIVHKK